MADAELLADGVAVGGDVRDDGRRVEELGEVARTADLLEALPVAEPARDLDDVDRAAVGLELEARLEDPAMGLRVEVLGLQVDDAVEALSSLMEPIIMVVLGVLIGGMVIAMYLPIFKLGAVVG